jgi:hypothetical protein
MKKIMMMVAALILMGFVAVQAETYEGLVIKSGNVYMLVKADKPKVAVANVLYPIKDALAEYEGKVVKVTGTLNPERKFPTLQTVDSVEIIGE